MIYQQSFPDYPAASEFYIGKIGHRLQEVTQTLDTTVGESKWQFCWRGDRQSLSFIGMCALYEDSYDAYFSTHPEDLTAISKYRDVYDTSESNVAAGTKFESVLHDTSIHLQDVVVRRCLARQGVGFTAANKQLLQVRSTSDTDLGRRLSPLYVPFIQPDIIQDDNPLVEVHGKLQPGSVEHFYHANRRLSILGLTSPEMFRETFEAQFGETIQLEPVPAPIGQ